jgi:hypothetical protein
MFYYEELPSHRGLAHFAPLFLPHETRANSGEPVRCGGGGRGRRRREKEHQEEAAEMDPDSVKSTLSNLAFGNVIAAAARDLQKVTDFSPPIFRRRLTPPACRSSAFGTATATGSRRSTRRWLAPARRISRLAHAFA